MRILFLSSEHAGQLGTGGVGSYVATITPALAWHGHEVHVLSCRPAADPTDELVDGVWLHIRPLIRTPGLRFLVPGEGSLHRLRLALSNRLHARGLGRFDVVEAPDWQAEGLLFGGPGGPPLVIHLHTPRALLHAFDDAPPGRDDRFADWLERLVARRANAVTSPSQLVVDRLREMGWLGPRSVEIIRYPVDLARFTPAPPAARPTVLAVGRLEARKRPELLVDAAALLRSEGIDFELRFLGRSSGTRDDLMYVDWLRQRAAAVGVLFPAPTELPWTELPTAYAGARVVAVCSYFESFSMVVVEAMASERPVVTTRDIGAAEVIVGVTAQRLEHDTAAGLAAALRTYLVDAERSAAVGSKNRADVEEACSPAIVAAERLRLFERLAKRASPVG